MNHPARKWDDLKARVMTALVLLLVAGYAIWVGGGWFVALLALAGAVMIWELACMVSPTQSTLAMVLGVLATIWASVFWQGSSLLGISSLLVAPIAGVFLLREGKVIFLMYGLAVVLGCVAFAITRFNFGLVPLLWLLGVVIGTDIAGYFAGRYLGGPKFWLRISPKKTWSGTIAGWIAAAAIGAIFVVSFGFDRQFILISVLVSMASQFGDITESAIKRYMDVKDSSGLLPGHGGVLDRFDGMVGAGLLTMIVILPMGAFTPAPN